MYKTIKDRVWPYLPSWLRAYRDSEEQWARQVSLFLDRINLPKDGKDPMLFWCVGGQVPVIKTEGAIALAMMARGHSAHFIICDGPFRACNKREIYDGMPVDEWSSVCKGCTELCEAVAKRMGLPYSFTGDHVSDELRSQLWEIAQSETWETVNHLTYRGLRIGKNVSSAVIRYFRGYGYEGSDSIVREFAYTALITAEAAISAYKQIAPWRVFMQHGIYSDWGPALNAAVSMEIPTVGFKKSYIKNHFMLRHLKDSERNDSVLFSKHDWEKIKSLTLTPAMEGKLQKYFDDYYKKKALLSNTDELRAKYDLNDDKPVWVVMTHLNWDAAADSMPITFPNFNDWIVATMDEIINLRGVRWLIKIHPSEGRDNPDRGVQKLLADRYPKLPGHIKLIPPGDNVSPTAIYDIVDGGVTVTGTPGLELSMRGKPVILAGEAHYGGKGFTYDGLTPEAYLGLLKDAKTIRPLEKTQIDLAKQYAYVLLLHKQIPFGFTEKDKLGFDPEKGSLLLPGNSPYVDFICDRIIDGKSFILDRDIYSMRDDD